MLEAAEGSMEEKLERVILWLKKLFGDHIPRYEVNERTVDILYELAEFHEARDSDVSLLAEDMKDWAAECNARANYLQDLLTKHLGLSPSSLSSEGTSNLSILEDCAMTLEMSNTCLGSFFSAMNDMTSELHEKESKNKELELAFGNIKNKMTAVLVLEQRLKAIWKYLSAVMRCEHIQSSNKPIILNPVCPTSSFQIRAGIFQQFPLPEVEGKPDFLTTFSVGSIDRVKEPGKTKTIPRDLEKSEQLLEAEKAKAETHSQKMKFLEDKSEDFNLRIKNAEEQLAATGLDQSLTHESLMSLSEKLEGVQKEIAPLKKELEAYDGLPPSIPLVKVKIAEVKRELEALDAEFAKEVDMLTRELPMPGKLRFT